MRAFIVKLQHLPETKKKIVLVAVVLVAAAVIGFFQVLSTFKHVAIIQKSMQSISFPAISLPDNNNKWEGISKLMGGLQPDGARGSLTDWQTYKNDEHGFGLVYPPTWQIDADHTSSIELTLVGVDGKDQAGIHLQILKIASAEKRLDETIAKMQEVILPKQPVTIGSYQGHEAIGTLCVGTCKGSAKDAYYPFSVTYLTGENRQVIQIQYAEALEGIWKKDMKEWKKYDQFKQIISTFNYTK